MAVRRILHVVGSPVSTFFCDLSELYARGCIDALRDPVRYDFVIAHLGPDGMWRFPSSLRAETLAAAPRKTLAEAIAAIAALGVDAALPQLFCTHGMIAVRAILELLEIPYLGNRAFQMALTADKAKAKAVVASAGVRVPRSQFARAGEPCGLAFPVVVKPNDSDNSDGVSLVRDASGYAAAVAAASAFSADVLVEEFVPLGREVRCGVIERRGERVALPLEEYYVDPALRPIRRAADKLARHASDELVLVAKTAAESWIVTPGDPVAGAVSEAALRCHAALGCRQYGLFDFRVDPAGRPWFLEAGLYCSYAPHSVIVTMMEAAGTPLSQFFAQSIEELLAQTASPEVRPC